MKKPIASPATSVALVASVAVAAPAQAYDEDAYAYAATHMLKSDDLLAALGDFGSNMSSSASQSSSKIYLCYIGQTNHTCSRRETLVRVLVQREPEGRLGQQPGPDDHPVRQRREGHLRLREAAEGGQEVHRHDDPDMANDDGSTQTSSSLTTNGKVPGVTEVGVESVFVNQNYLSTSSNAKDRYASDTYTVFTLLNDVILSTNYSSGNLRNIPTKLRKKVKQVAFTAIDRWLD